MIHFKSEKSHSIDVEKIKNKILHSKSPLSLASRAPSNTLRNGEYKIKSDRIDLSSLDSVITLNVEELWITVEPRITVKKLCEITLEYGLIPLVVPEFSSITVGGAILGSALESSSHRHGQFNDSCTEYEVILGNGTVLKASAEVHEDLFYGLSGSYGSLALLTLAKLKLMPVKPFVKLGLHPLSASSELFSFFKQNADKDFLEAIAVDATQSIAITGTFTETSKNLSIYRQKTPWHPWFYQKILQLTKNGNAELVMPVKDYLFRLDRGAFWMGRYLLRFSLMLRILFKWRLSKLDAQLKKFAHFLHPHDNPSFLFRFFLGWKFTSQRLYKIWHEVPKKISERLFFIQDFYTPLDKGEETFQSFSKKTGIYPIWLCPLKGAQDPQFLSPHFGASSYVNIGLYGVPRSGVPIPQLTAELEKDIIAKGGRKMLYSLTYYSQDFFSKAYDLKKYADLRKKYHAEGAFLSLEEKILHR